MPTVSCDSEAEVCDTLVSKFSVLTKGNKQSKLYTEWLLPVFCDEILCIGFAQLGHTRDGVQESGS